MKKVIRYQASDGTEFVTIEDCEYHESKLQTPKPQDFIKMFDSNGVEINFNSIIDIGKYTNIPQYVYVKEWNQEVEEFFELLKDLSEYKNIPRGDGLWRYERWNNYWYPAIAHDRMRAEGALKIYEQFIKEQGEI